MPLTPLKLVQALLELRVPLGNVSAQDLCKRAEEATDFDTFESELIDQELLTQHQFDAIVRGEQATLAYDDYVIFEPIGHGGMGQVYRAWHRIMKRFVALKLMHESLANSETHVQRFQREVQAAGKLIHPNIVTALDAGECHGRHYLVSEFVEGKDFERIVRSDGPLPIRGACLAIIDAANGLQFARDSGLIHRDIKPGNILRREDGRAQILDMGLASITNEVDAAEPLTHSGDVFGTGDYMAPEQARDAKQADERSDVYSLGTVS